MKNTKQSSTGNNKASQLIPQQLSPQSSQKDSGGALSQKQVATPQSAGRTRGQSKKILENGPGSSLPQLEPVGQSAHGDNIPQNLPPMISPVASALGPPLTPSGLSTSSVNKRMGGARVLKLQGPSLEEIQAQQVTTSQLKLSGVSGSGPSSGTNHDSNNTIGFAAGNIAGSVVAHSLQDTAPTTQATTPVVIPVETQSALLSTSQTKLSSTSPRDLENLVKKPKLVASASQKKKTIEEIKYFKKEPGCIESIMNDPEEGDEALKLLEEEDEEEDDFAEMQDILNLDEVEDAEEALLLLENLEEVDSSVGRKGEGTESVTQSVVPKEVACPSDNKPTITDKEFYKAMQKLKDRGTGAVPPKKSASAYILFGKEKRAEILKRTPLAKVTEVVKEIAQSWKILTKEDRQRYKEAAKRDKERYEKELKSLESHSDMLKKPKKCLSAYMIFVKETRPLIVDEHPEMGALQVMQQVGKQWQQMTEESRAEFKLKADRDKVRYLQEQKAFYDEVEKIGKDVGTVTTKEGKVVVASTVAQISNSGAPGSTTGQEGGGKKGAKSAASNKQNADLSNNLTQNGLVSANGEGEGSQMGNKRKIPETQSSGAQMSDTPSKRLKIEDNGQQMQSSSLLINTTTTTTTTQGLMTNKIAQQNYSSQLIGGQPVSIQIPANSIAGGQPGNLPPQWQTGYPNPMNQLQSANGSVIQGGSGSALADSQVKPKKPLSAYIYFSQEFRDIIRQRYPSMTVQQVMRAVTFRWKNLTKEQKAPFEQIAVEDKQRYDRELTQFKRGAFPGRSQTPQMKLASGSLSILGGGTPENEHVAKALEIDQEFLLFVQQNCQSVVQNNQQSSVKKEDGANNGPQIDDLPDDLNEEDLEALKEAEKMDGMINNNANNENHLSTLQQQNSISEIGSTLGNVVPHHDQTYIAQQMSHPQDHLLTTHPGLIGGPMDPMMMQQHHQQHPGMMPNYNQQMLPPNPGYHNPYGYYGQPLPYMQQMQHHQNMMPPPSFIDHINKFQLPQQMGGLPPQPTIPQPTQQQLSFQYALQNSLGANPYGGVGGGFGNSYDTSIHANRNYLQNELQNREYDRKTSMSFGFGQMFPPSSNNFGASPALNPQSHQNQNLMSSPNIHMQNPYAGMGPLDDPQLQQAAALMGGGYLLPPNAGGSHFQLPPSNLQAASHSSWGATSATQQHTSHAQGSNSFNMKPPSPFMHAPHNMRKFSSPQLGPSISGAFGGSQTAPPPLIQNVSFSSSALFPQNSGGIANNQSSGGAAGDNHGTSNISPFLAPQSNPLFQPPTPMLYQSPSFGGLSGNLSMMQNTPSLGQGASGSNPFLRNNSGTVTGSGGAGNGQLQQQAETNE